MTLPYLFNESGENRVCFRKTVSGHGQSEGFDGVGVLWAESVGEIGNCLFVHGDGIGVLSRPPVCPCEFFARFDGGRVFGPEDVRKIGN